jgi:hypothetical protein
MPRLSLIASLRQSRVTFPLPVPIPTYQMGLHSNGHPFYPGCRAESCLITRLACPALQNLVLRHTLECELSTSIESHISVIYGDSSAAILVPRLSPMNLRPYARGNEREPTCRRSTTASEQYSVALL